MENLNQFCKTHDTTPQSVYFTTWSIVLYHMTGQSDVSIDVESHSASALAERPGCETYNMILRSATTPLELISEYKFPDSSSSVEKGTKRSRDSNIKDRHMFKMIQDAGVFQDERNKFTSSSFDYASYVHLLTESDIATLRIIWRSGLQDLEEITNIFEHTYNCILSQPDASLQSMGSPTLSQLELLPTGSEQSQDLNIPDLLRLTSSKFPSKEAISAWDGDLSYQELQDTSDRWAKALLSHGLTAGDSVIHAFQHSQYAIVAWLAILKAGCTCVPIDVSTPIERLKNIIDSTTCKAAVCDTAGSSHLGSTSLSVLTTSDLDGSGERDVIDVGEVSTSSTAVIIFTSGSTGQPKGVIQTHGAVASSLVKFSKVLGLDQESRFLQFAPHCFDVSISEIFGTFVAGGCLCIPAPDKKLTDIAKNINTMEVTHAILTPTVAKMLSTDQVPSLQSLSVGGEPCSSKLRETWSQQLQFNVLYGSTEGGVWDTIKRVKPDDDFSVPSIGNPIGGRVWIVHPDDWTILSPIGVPGEICIQGPDIATGYLGDKQKTQLAFKLNPPWLTRQEGSLSSCHHIFRTGDRGLVLEDGSLRIFGRIDRQIKINGQRIEPGEIEETFRRFLPDHLNAFVDTFAPRGDKPRLVVFFSHGQNSEPSLMNESDLDPAGRNAIHSSREVLPDTMVPSVAIPVTAFPMTQTNKIDRQAIRKLGMAFFDSLNTSTSPGHIIEDTNSENNDKTKVKDVIGRFLQEQGNGCPNGLEDPQVTFKDLGIDSMDAMSLASTLKGETQIDISASKLMDPNLCVEELADMPDDHGKDGRSLLKSEIEKWTTELDKIGSSRDHCVFLTGPNGFLGREILRKVLQCPSKPRITCLMRGKDYHHAHKRFFESCRELCWWNDSLEERVQVWLGDLTQPKAGLEEGQWDIIFGLNGQPRQFDVIVHNGAIVNWLEPYESLQNTNVFSTHEFLAGFLQSQDPPQTVYVSGGYLSSLDETHEELVEKIGQLSAYDQTKFVSEFMVRHVQSIRDSGGSRLWTFKPGFIVGSTENGYAQTGDALWRMVKACVQAGSYSQDDARNWITAAGVDTIASLLVDQMLSPSLSSCAKRTEKVLDGLYLGEIWDILETMDIHLRPMEHEEWCEAIQKDLQEREPEDCVNMMKVALSNKSEEIYTLWEDYLTTLLPIVKPGPVYKEKVFLEFILYRILFSAIKNNPVKEARVKHTLRRLGNSCSLLLAKELIALGASIEFPRDGKGTGLAALHLASKNTSREAALLMRYLILKGAAVELNASPMSVIWSGKGAGEMAKWVGMTWEELHDQYLSSLPEHKRK
ncbi:nonribosomal peptide synthetase [Fusarium pseudocircinatum]|uniref:Nonribosomal peptide synthetase n=1 Tax=Fusarium pseudocircinatum TaxID=56676 RepID=A0A8H5KS24_9HYPO|nr:nonribosomal peptide synthetase [Fusarium pseudocircinatum]